MGNVQEKLTISAEWLAAGHGGPEIGQTAALIRIMVGESLITSIEDRWSRSTRSDVALSAYPLALWLAASWWRLRWESSAVGGKLSTSWRMAHEVAAAGYGFVWPNLRFESDGNQIDIVSHVTNPRSKEMVRYLSDFRGVTSAHSFEKSIDEFVSLVLARLDAVKINGTELHQLWTEVLRERSDRTAAKWRRLEATAGFDPGELSENQFSLFRNLEATAGRMAISEVAACCQGNDPQPVLTSVSNQASAAKLVARVPEISLPHSYRKRSDEPWREGRTLASFLRKTLGLGVEVITSKQLSATLSLPIAAFERAKNENDTLLGMAVRKKDSNEMKVSFRRSSSTGRRFEAARLLCDSLLAPRGENWLPWTDTKTSRQKLQRAFAAEFLCPLDSLKSLVGNNPSTSGIENAAEHFQISPLAVASHLANNGILSPERLMEFHSTS